MWWHYDREKKRIEARNSFNPQLGEDMNKRRNMMKCFTRMNINGTRSNRIKKTHSQTPNHHTNL